MSNKKSLKFAAITPHPPIIIPTIGGSADLEKVSKTIGAMEKLAEIFAKAAPDTVIIISPHGPVDLNQFSITNFPVLDGHFYNFGDFQTELIFKNDLKFIEIFKREIQKSSQPNITYDRKSFLASSVPLRTVNMKELDHGALVPLYYLVKYHSNFRVVHISYSFLEPANHFELGRLLQKTIAEFSNRTIGIVASGDLSHRLTPDAPAGFSSRGKEFDEKLIELLRNKDIEGILNMSPDFIEEAGECGYRSIIILLGALDNLNWQPEILSYEGPFGVGYLVANIKLY